MTNEQKAKIWMWVSGYCGGIATSIIYNLIIKYVEYTGGS